MIQDFLNIVSRRHAALHVLLYPAMVQGETAAAEVAAGIAWFNRTREVDVIVIARGGGSLEDLAPFNTERLAEAIAASDLPVISAVGHETDFTIADFVADLRAPTPSAAAEIATAALHNVAERVAELDQRLQRACRYRLMQARDALVRVRVESILMQEMDQLRRKQQRVDDMGLRMEVLWRGGPSRGERAMATAGGATAAAGYWLAHGGGAGAAGCAGRWHAASGAGTAALVPGAGSRTDAGADGAFSIGGAGPRLCAGLR